MIYSHNNYTAKGLDTRRSDNVADFWNSWSKMIQVKYVKRNFTVKTRNCQDQQTPFNENLSSSVNCLYFSYSVYSDALTFIWYKSSIL